MPSTAETHLVRELERAQRLHDQRKASPGLASALDRLARWQSQRLNATYADLARDPRYAAAIRFFQADLYGPGDYSRRDADLVRVVPLMARLLPEGVIATIAKAIELSALSHELDRRLLVELGQDSPLTVRSYCAAYRACGNRADRERQIALIVEVGSALDRYVHLPLLRSALAAMRRPARIAGLGALQEFLERGLLSFRGMNGAAEFLQVLEARETALMRAILDGDDAPFAEPA
ncbi:MAG: FFLEELY motif protein [Casimicrobiaceae bacterium]